jgi:hypothetical protein
VIASQNKGKMITCPLRILTEKGSSVSTESNNYRLPRYIKPKSDRQSSYKATSIACQNMKPKSDRQSAQQATSIACQNMKPKSDRQSAKHATMVACQDIKPKSDRQSAESNTDRLPA